MFLDHLEHEAKTFKPPGKLIKEFTRQGKGPLKSTSLFGVDSKATQTKDKLESIKLKVYKVSAT